MLDKKLFELNNINNINITKSLIKPKLINKLVNTNDLLFDDIDLKENIYKINKCITLFGKECFNITFKNPTYNLNIINKRKYIIKKLYPMQNYIKRKLIHIQEFENEILWFWNDNSQKLIYDMVYFQWFPILNTNSMFMNIINYYNIFISPSISFLTPLITIIIPLIILRIKGINLNWNIIKTIITLLLNMLSNQSSNILTKLGLNPKLALIISILVSIGMYIQGIYYTIKNSYNSYKIINTLHSRINTINKFIKEINNISIILKRILPFKYNKLPEIDLGELCIFNNKGQILSEYYKFINNKDCLIPYINYIAEIDCYINCCSLLKNDKFHFMKFGKNMKIKKIFHPWIGYDNCIKNNINLEKSALITGSNASGKSTFIKAVLLNTLLGQTFGISCSSSSSIPLFEIIHSYIRIPDKVGSESQFEAEMHRTNKYINLIKHNKKSFIVIDELFTSTNSNEGISMAYAICKNICKYTNTKSLITTHYHELSKFNNIDKYYFKIIRDENNTIKFTYKINKGISKDCIALDLLKNSNFDKNIINDAKNYLRSI